MKIWLCLNIIITSHLICVCMGGKTQLVHEMTTKLCQIAREKLKIQHATPQNKAAILEYLRDKLVKSAGITSPEHIKIILQGISLLGDDDNYKKFCMENATKPHRRIMPSNSTTVQEKVQNKSTTLTLVTTEKLNLDKETEVKEVVKQIEKLVEKIIKNATTFDEKLKKVDALKQNIIHSFSRELTKNEINSNKTKSYSQLLGKGIDLTVKKLLANETRRMSLEFVNDGDAKIDEEPLIAQNAPELLKDPVTAVTPRSTKRTTTYIVGLTKDSGDLDGCAEVVSHACSELKSLDFFKCEYDGTTLSTQQVCDGAIDCPDASDEKNCIQQVITKVHSATQAMSKVELSRYCFQSLHENSVISRQGQLLSDLLNSQIAFLKKYVVYSAHTRMVAPNKPSKGVTVKRMYHPLSTVNEIVSEVALVIRTFGTSLYSALCMKTDTDVKRAVESSPSDMIEDELDKVIAETEWSANICDCYGQFCKNITCDPLCKRFCYQVFSLNRLPCKSVLKGLSSVSIDLVCDGKLDCFDELDERNCAEDNSLSKFEGNRIFNAVINSLKDKLLSRDYIPMRVQLVELQVQVQNLQKRGTSPKVYNDSFKVMRDMYFKMVRAMYTEMMDSARAMKNGEPIYDFFLNLNQRMIEGMKRTHIGNHKILSSDNCLCRGRLCAQAKCSERCQKNCVVKDLLTNYICEESPSQNVTVPIDWVCNGKLNCPNAEDELNCSQEICRIHHIKLLRHNINLVDVKYKGTILGDALDTWKNKVIPALVVLENRDRLTPKILKGAVYEMLNDLTLTYMSLDKYRRLNVERILKKFTKLSQHIISSLKTCTKT